MIKKLISFLLNLIMSFLVLSLIFIMLVSNTVLKKEFIKQQFKNNNFYERTYSDIKEDFENYTMQSGLELEILEDLFSKEKVTKDINLKIDSIYNDEKIDIDTSSIVNELDIRINNALEKNNRIPSEEEKKSIQKYEDVIRESYISGILYGEDLEINVNYFKKAEMFCIIGIIGINIFLLILNKSILKLISYIGINFLFSGIIFVSIKFIIENRIQYILVLDAKFSKFLIDTLNIIIGKFYHWGIIFIILGIIFSILGSLEKIKKTIENK